MALLFQLRCSAWGITLSLSIKVTCYDDIKKEVPLPATCDYIYTRKRIVPVASQPSEYSPRQILGKTRHHPQLHSHTGSLSISLGKRGLQLVHEYQPHQR